MRTSTYQPERKEQTLLAVTILGVVIAAAAAAALGVITEDDLRSQREPAVAHAQEAR